MGRTVACSLRRAAPGLWQRKARPRDRGESVRMSPVRAEFLGLVDRLAARAPLPAVRAVHLPPPAADGTRDGEFCAVELEDGSLGLSFVLLGDTLARLRAPGRHDALTGMPAPALARCAGTPRRHGAGRRARRW